ncbi:hypothetical protein ACFYNO_37770 [Kitasatospora sp. NPDC006697]|uniref:hypothetical protein n=1 Tax=Kitasatospora sp. NPDC006697 TaxID=3364020 RepID=UPI0036B2368C
MSSPSRSTVAVRALRRRAVASLAALLATAGFAALPTAPAQAVPLAPAAAVQPATTRACAAPAPGSAACFAVRRTDVAPAAAPTGYGPADLRQAYALTADSTRTVAIVDAYDDPTAEQDLTAYRSQYGLPACSTANGCFHKVNQTGAAAPLPAADPGWAGEISLDLDMVSAVCPHCTILLVEANDSLRTSLYAAEDYATGHAGYVSNSWGTPEYAGETGDDAHFDRPGVAITVSTGDSGYGTEYPAASPLVTAVGGTTLQRSGGARGWTETAWSGAGSGCSAYEPRPGFQQSVATGCAGRAIADVSAVADPGTGVAVYQTYGASGWTEYGGTSVAAPITAAVYALAGRPGAADRPAGYPYAYPGKLNDVTGGGNGSCGGSPLCAAGPGWDGPTGLGTPAGTPSFAATRLWQFAVVNSAWVATDVAAGAGGSATGTPSSDSGSTWVRGADGHLWQYFQQNGQWIAFDLTAATGVAVSGDPVGSGGGVYARDTNGHLVQFYVSGNAWVAFDVTAATGAAISAGPAVDGGVEYARGGNGDLLQFYVSNGAWVAFDVSAATGVPIAGAPQSQGGTVYARDAAGHLRQFFVSGGRWVSFDVSAATGAAIAGDPTAGGAVYARGSNGDLLQFYVANGAWVAFDVSAATGVPIAGNPVSLGGAQYARTAAGHLVQFFVSGGRWVSFDVSAATGTPVTGDPNGSSSAIWTT